MLVSMVEGVPIASESNCCRLLSDRCYYKKARGCSPLQELREGSQFGGDLPAGPLEFIGDSLEIHCGFIANCSTR
jgi:hypothetical protein